MGGLEAVQLALFTTQSYVDRDSEVVPSAEMIKIWLDTQMDEAYGAVNTLMSGDFADGRIPPEIRQQCRFFGYCLMADYFGPDGRIAEGRYYDVLVKYEENVVIPQIRRANKDETSSGSAGDSDIGTQIWDRYSVLNSVLE